MCMKKPQRKHSELKEPDETLHKAKTLTTIARQKKAKEKAPKRTSQTGKEPYKNTLQKNRAYKMLKWTTKPLWRTVPIEEGLALKRITRRTQTSGIFVKQVVLHTVNHRGPLPLKELHSTGETIVWRDPGGSWACLPPVYICVWNHPATVCDMWTTPEKHTKRRETLGNTNQNKTTKRAGYKKVYEKHTKGSIQN